MSDTSEPLRGEPSYYEISLTNRQVVITFVILLTFVLAIFLCGVWVGKNGQARLAQTTDADPNSEVEQPEQLANMEEFKFFTEEGAENTSAPDLSVLAGPSEPTEPQRDDPPVREQSPPAPAPAPQPTTNTAPPAQPTSSQPTPRPEPTRAEAPPQSRPAPPPKTEPATASPPASLSAGFVVQVFSTRDETQARKVLQRLKGAKHNAFLSAVEVTGQTMYRVRVGPFSERDAADRVAAQVRRQMKLDPWVTAAGN